MRATQGNSFLRQKNGVWYLVRRSRSGGKRSETWTKLADLDREILEAALRVKDDITQVTVEYPCTNPRCKNKVKMTKMQAEEMFISSKKRYDLMVFPFCCTKCRDEALAEHGGALDGVNKS